MRGGYVQKPVKEIIAVRALFPLEYAKAVRQKARWIIGIVFQEWYHSRWPKEWSVRYTLAHDRKSFITHFINGFGYFVFTFWLLYSLLTYAAPEYPTLQERFNVHTWVWWMIVISTGIMCERLIQRMIATYRIYGFVPACLVLPRAFYGNILNLHVLIRAYRIYFTAPKSNTTSNQPVWDKTEHHFPDRHLLVPYRKRLGDLLLDSALLTQEQLRQAIIKQQKTGQRLGQVLCQLNFITPEQIIQLLSTQYNLPLFPHNKTNEATSRCAPLVPRKTTQWLYKHGVCLVDVDEVNKTLTVAIDDPTNELLLGKIIDYIMPYKTQFMLIEMD